MRSNRACGEEGHALLLKQERVKKGTEETKRERHNRHTDTQTHRHTHRQTSLCRSTANHRSKLSRSSSSSSSPSSRVGGTPTSAVGGCLMSKQSSKTCSRAFSLLFVFVRGSRSRVKPPRSRSGPLSLSPASNVLDAQRQKGLSEGASA